MLKSFAIGACLALLAACAATPTKPPATAAVKPPAGCVAQTATRLPVKDDACVGFGNTYTHEDIQRTGETTIGPALSTLDPSIRSTGH